MMVKSSTTNQNLVEDAPTNSMGASSSGAGTGGISTFDPLLKQNKKKPRVLKRFKDFKSNDKRIRTAN